MKLNGYKKKYSGFILLEILVAIAVIGVAFAALLTIGMQALNFSSNVRATTKIDFLIREEIEALRSFRDGTDWSTNGLGAVNTGSGNPYYLSRGSNPDVWNLVSGTETVEGFTRFIVFDKVSRDGSGNIQETYNPANLDPDVIKVTVNIKWLSKTYQVVTYLTNWKYD